MGLITGDGTALVGLGGAAGYGETALPRADDGVTQVDVGAVFEAGFTIGGVHYAADALFISTDGLISFGSGVGGVVDSLNAIAAPFLAIFHGDVDTRLDGEGAESGGVWLDVDAAQDCVTITWDHVGFYRRNATLTNTFQLQLFDRGNGGFEAVFRYQDIQWTSGDLQGGWGGLGGTAALVGVGGGAGDPARLLPASGQEAGLLGLASGLGNTGVAGLWLWDFTNPSVVLGSAAADTLAGTALDDTLRGLGGDDRLLGSAGRDLMEGGLGADRADYGAAAAAVLIDLADLSRNQGQAAGDRYIGIESFAGSGFGDALFGAAGNNWFLGLAGDDTLEGRLGDDRLEGGAGNDSLRGGAGADVALGGTGNDSLLGEAGNDSLLGGAGDDSVSGDDGDDTLAGNDGNDSLIGGAGNDHLSGDGGGEGDDLLQGGTGQDSLIGGGGSDRLFGGADNDLLRGDLGNDALFGEAGQDDLLGGIGADRLYGGTEDDTLTGGAGQDSLAGGFGADQFRHFGLAGEGEDLVLDYRHGQGDLLWFGLEGATRADFDVSLDFLPGVGSADVAEVQVRYLPTGQLLWTLQDGAAQAQILVQSSMNSFDLW